MPGRTRGRKGRAPAACRTTASRAADLRAAGPRRCCRPGARPTVRTDPRDHKWHDRLPGQLASARDKDEPTRWLSSAREPRCRSRSTPRRRDERGLHDERQLDGAARPERGDRDRHRRPSTAPRKGDVVSQGQGPLVLISSPVSARARCTRTTRATSTAGPRSRT